MVKPPYGNSEFTGQKIEQFPYSPAMWINILLLQIQYILMTNQSVNGSAIAQALKSVASFWRNLFVPSSTKEFNRLKDFIAS